MSDEMQITLSPSTSEAIEKLSRRSGYDPAELVSVGLGIVKLFIEAQEQGHVIVETSREGKKLAKLRLPESEAHAKTGRKLETEAHSLSLERAIADLDPDNASPAAPSGISVIREPFPPHP